MRVLRTVRSRTALLSLLALAAFGSSATVAQDSATPPAAAPLSAEEALAVDAKQYAQRYNVPIDEAARRIVLMAGTDDQVAQIETEFGDRLSGVYFDNSAEFGLVVRLTGADKPADRRLNRSAVAGNKGNGKARRELPNVSAAEVEQVAAIVDAPVSAPMKFQAGARKARREVLRAIDQNNPEIRQLIPDVEVIGYDERAGAVVIQSHAPEARRAAAQAALPKVEAMFDAPVQLKFVPGPLKPAAVVGGSKIYWGGTSNLNCTVGFPALDSAGNQGFFTAGHCYDATWSGGYNYWDNNNPNAVYTVSPILASRTYDNSSDIMFVRAPVGLDASNTFFGQRNEAARVVTGRRTLANTNTKGGTAQGSWVAGSSTVQGTQVCFYGQRTGPTFGQSCGEVTFKGVRYNCGGTACGGWFVEIQGTMTCNQGDSGAPVFAWQTAFGVLNGCDPYATTAGATTRVSYTSIDAMYARGYALKY
jgi:hypothetical protein